MADENRVRINIENEYLEPMHVESHQVLHSSRASQFRSLVARHIKESVAEYQRKINHEVSFFFPRCVL